MRPGRRHSSGRHREQGPVTEVFLKPKHEVTQEFIRQEMDSGEALRLAIQGQANGPSRAVQITFLGSKTYESILSHTVHETGVNFAILQGTISTIKETPYGQLIVRLKGQRAPSKIRSGSYWNKD